jgi:hypothetical protein
MEEIILNICFSVGASIAFFYVYKKTKLLSMLVAGGITYFELLIRLFMEQAPIMMQGINLLLIPEVAIIIYMAYYTYRDGFKYIPLMLIVLLISFFSMMSIGHKFYGDIGIMFGLIMIIWVNVSSYPCKTDPWNCQVDIGDDYNGKY